jgi:large subunit ribosomal protein L18
MAVKKSDRRDKIRRKIRATIIGTAERPRMSIFRSNKGIYVQLIDDANGTTLVAASSGDKGIEGAKGTKIEQSKMVGAAVAEKAKEAGIDKVVFDRGGYLYHGRVKSLAEGAREGGLQF